MEPRSARLGGQMSFWTTRGGDDPWGRVKVLDFESCVEPAFDWRFLE